MSVRTQAAAVAAATALLALPPAPAAADDQNDGRLFLTVSGSQNTWIRGIRLICPAADGHHPHAADACKALALAHGRLEELPEASRTCAPSRDPVTATADGDWHGAPVAWRRTFPNTCALEAATGPVFRF
ncbi:hypothetical protein BLA24_09185 [Streptomyces cinnamoneus]|uniref:Subtilisin inhibitor domain-containing protein n=1 Tax=Streptomyces cinnamoneus TaxID=53446 RepID=A0A2G1XLG2_STRCJ|nr:SSI family serine proteinase inhibitor [Streptomyces cinnamoneus]PHQ52088.1 hypothetical protein BLA24_09185 [Streptomyces cinnamoneus]PPT16168.1 protease inhibitor [Streptomyces cinnamoneus]